MLFVRLTRFPSDFFLFHLSTANLALAVLIAFRALTWVSRAHLMLIESHWQTILRFQSGWFVSPVSSMNQVQRATWRRHP